jgi:hypothetical protein
MGTKYFILNAACPGSEVAIACCRVPLVESTCFKGRCSCRKLTVLCALLLCPGVARFSLSAGGPLHCGPPADQDHPAVSSSAVVAAVPEGRLQRQRAAANVLQLALLRQQ